MTESRVEAVIKALCDCQSLNYEQITPEQHACLKIEAEHIIEASDAWLKATHGFDLMDAVAAYCHQREVARRRAIWDGLPLPAGTTREDKVCDCINCPGWTSEFPVPPWGRT